MFRFNNGCKNGRRLVAGHRRGYELESSALLPDADDPAGVKLKQPDDAVADDAVADDGTPTTKVKDENDDNSGRRTRAPLSACVEGKKCLNLQCPALHPCTRCSDRAPWLPMSEFQPADGNGTSFVRACCFCLTLLSPWRCHAPVLGCLLCLDDDAIVYNAVSKTGERVQTCIFHRTQKVIPPTDLTMGS